VLVVLERIAHGQSLLCLLQMIILGSSKELKTPMTTIFRFLVTNPSPHRFANIVRTGLDNHGIRTIGVVIEADGVTRQM